MFPVGKTKIRILIAGRLNKQKELRNLGIERLKSVGYTVNGHNWSFFIMVFSPQRARRTQRNYKSITSNLRASSCRGLIFFEF